MTLKLLIDRLKREGTISTGCIYYDAFDGNNNCRKFCNVKYNKYCDRIGNITISWTDLLTKKDIIEELKEFAMLNRYKLWK